MESNNLRIPNNTDLNKLSSWFIPTNPLTEPVPPLEFIVDGYCARGSITVIGGSAGSGKSLFNQILFQKRNDELLPTKEGEALYITGADSSENEVRRRAKAIKINSGLYTVPLPEDLYCVATNGTFMDELGHQIKYHGFDAVIFDTLADFHEGNLYEAEIANQTMQQFTHLARSANVAVILITHTRKGSKIKVKYDVEDISDSRVFATKADFVFALKSEYQTDGSNLVELQALKNRKSQAIPPFRAVVAYNSEKEELFIRPSDRLFSTELQDLSKEQEKKHLAREVNRLKSQNKSVREISKELNISIGSVSNYSNAGEQDK